MKALVTGASGFIGANLVRELLASGHTVRAFVRPTSGLAGLAGLDVEIARGDVLRPETLDEAARGCDVLFHAASVFAYWGVTFQALERLAVDGSLHAVEAAKRTGVKRVVLTSSSVVLGSGTRPLARDERAEFADRDPPPYAIAKLHQERAALARAMELGVELVAVCPTLVVGPHDLRLGPSNALLLSYLADPWKATFPGGGNIVSALDVAHGHLLAATRGKPGERYLLAAAENLEWGDLHRMLSELCGLPGPTVRAGHTSAFLASAAHELLARITGVTPSTTRVQARMVGRYYWYRNDRARRELGFTPRPARQALAEALAWLVASPHLSRELRRRIWLASEVWAARRQIDWRPHASP